MIITSPKGREMFETVSPIYYQSRIMQGIFQSVGLEWDDIDKIADDILLQLFPQTATWGLRYWEELLQIPVNKSISLDRRRALVITRLKLRSPMTPERISNVIGSLTKGQSKYVEVTENVEPHVFMVTIGTDKPGIDYLDVYRTLRRIKPSHESFYLANSYLRSFYLKRNSISGFSEIIHAIGTFVSNKEAVPFMATKGYRNNGALLVNKKRIIGSSTPIACSQRLKFTSKGFSNSKTLNVAISRIKGLSSPLVCSKNLKYTRIEVV